MDYKLVALYGIVFVVLLVFKSKILDSIAQRSEVYKKVNNEIAKLKEIFNKKIKTLNETNMQLKENYNKKITTLNETNMQLKENINEILAKTKETRYEKYEIEQLAEENILLRNYYSENHSKNSIHGTQLKDFLLSRNGELQAEIIELKTKLSELDRTIFWREKYYEVVEKTTKYINNLEAANSSSSDGELIRKYENIIIEIDVLKKLARELQEANNILKEKIYFETGKKVMDMEGKIIYLKDHSTNLEKSVLTVKIDENSDYSEIEVEVVGSNINNVTSRFCIGMAEKLLSDDDFQKLIRT